MWNGEQDRSLKVERFCSCGTCQAAKPDGAVGYLTGSDTMGRGFTVYLWDEPRYMLAVAAFGGDVS